MAIRPYNPFDEMEQLFERMSRSFEMPEWSGKMGSTMSVDVAEHEDEYVVTADLPGFSKADIDLTVEDDRLYVSASRETDEDVESEQFIHKERRTTSASRTIALPGPVNEVDVGATYKNGVLTVTLPKVSTSERSTSIEIS